MRTSYLKAMTQNMTLSPWFYEILANQIRLEVLYSMCLTADIIFAMGTDNVTNTKYTTHYEIMEHI